MNNLLHKPHHYTRFFLIYFGVILIPLIFIILSLIFLWRSHELSSYDQIVAYQLKNNAIYGPGTSVDYFEYKLKMIEQVKPETVVLGSSRALGFQGAYFKTSFVNAGSAMRSLEEGTLFLKKMVRHNAPKNLIVTLDFWWFNKATAPYALTYKQFNKQSLTTDKLLLAYRLMSEKKLSISQFLAFTLLGYSKNSLTHYQNTGVMGIISSNGNRSDGSMLYSEFALGGRSDLDPQFSHAKELITKGYGNYEHGKYVYKKRLKMLDNFLKICHEHNINVYLVIPPLAPSVRKMTIDLADEYHYIDELRTYLAQLPVPVFDFHDTSTIPATNCEFIDGYHSGDITYIKMLLRMVESPKSTRLASIIKIPEAKKAVSKFEGNVIDRSDAQYFTGNSEKDFLLLGCLKK